MNVSATDDMQSVQPSPDRDARERARAAADDAKDLCASTLGLGALFEIADELVGLDALPWIVLRFAVAAVFCGAAAVWAVMGLRAAGGARTWLVPTLAAVAAATALALLSLWLA